MPQEKGSESRMKLQLKDDGNVLAFNQTRMELKLFRESLGTPHTFTVYIL